MTDFGSGGRLAGMFRSKRKKEQQEQQASQPAQAQPPPPQPSAGGYVVTELPTFHGRHRKVVVYTSDGSGKIIKTFKKSK